MGARTDSTGRPRGEFTWPRAALALVGVVVVGALVVSGNSSTDPSTPPALPGLPPPFLGVAVVGDGGLTAAIDSYGDIVDIRSPGPAGRGLIENPVARQTAGTVPADTGIVPRAAIGDGPGLPLWHADWVRQRYLPGTNVLRTEALLGDVRIDVTYAVHERVLACLTGVSGVNRSRTTLTAGQPPRKVDLDFNLLGGRERVHCNDAAARRAVGKAIGADRRWIARARPLGEAAPGWARRMYVRSLLVLRALSDRHTGAVAAGARDGWAYVWPRDAGTAALAFAAAGYRQEAQRTARFLLKLDLDAAARFDGNGSPIPGREAQGDARGWVEAAARAAGLPTRRPGQAQSEPSESQGRATTPAPHPWRGRSDYQEKSPGDFLANAIASSTLPADGPKTSIMWTESAHRQAVKGIWGEFGTADGLVRAAGSGVDAAAAWAVRPFPLPALFPAVRESLRHLLARGGRFGIVPSEDWPEADPWTAPTAWSAWSFAALSQSEKDGGAKPKVTAGSPMEPGSGTTDRDRQAALHLLGDLRRAATPAGMLPERVDARTGVPRSTTPLAWSHAFAILALQQLWPGQKTRLRG